MPRLAIVSRASGSPPPRSPTREKLAELIAAKRERDACRAAIAAAHSKAADEVRAARQRVTDAECDPERAKGATADAVVAQALGRAVQPHLTIKAARAAVLEAGDELEAREAAHGALAEQLHDAQADAWKDSAVREAALAVIRESPAVAAALADVERLQRELVEKGSLLAWLADGGVVQNARTGTLGSYPEPGSMAHRVRAAVYRLNAPPAQWHELIREVPLAARAWEAALAALMQDADTALPGDSA